MNAVRCLTAVFCLGCCLWLPTSTAHADSTEQTLKTLPEAVQKTIRAASQSGSIVSIGQKPKAGAMRYRVALTVHGKSRKIVVDASGKLLKAKDEVTAESLAPAVRTAVEAQSRGAKIEHIEQIAENGKTEYEVKMDLKGHTREVVFDPTGAVVQVEEVVALDSVPAAVKSQIEKTAGQAKVLKVEAVSDHGKLTLYEAELELNAKKSEIKVSLEGRLLSRE